MIALWLALSPYALDYGGTPRIVGHVAAVMIGIGAQVAVYEEAPRLNAVLGAVALFLLAAPLLFGYPLDAAINSTLCGLALGALTARTRAARARLHLQPTH